jgi:hypothetical protein
MRKKDTTRMKSWPILDKTIRHHSKADKLKKPSHATAPFWQDGESRKVLSSTIKKQDFEGVKKTSGRKGGKSELNAVKTAATVRRG